MDTVKELESWARKNAALHYEDDRVIDSAIASMHEQDWEGYYPEVDGRGCLTGNVVGIGTEGYVNVGDEVYVREDALSREQLRDVDEGQLGRIAPDGKKHFRVVAEQTRQVTFIIDADSEDEAKEYYGEGQVIREDEGELKVLSAEEYGGFKVVPKSSPAYFGRLVKKMDEVKP